MKYCSMENGPEGTKYAHVVIKVVASPGVGHLTPNSGQPLALAVREQEKT